MFEALIFHPDVHHISGSDIRGHIRTEDRCWQGHEPVPGKEPYTANSCRKVGDHTSGVDQDGNHRNMVESNIANVAKKNLTHIDDVGYVPHSESGLAAFNAAKAKYLDVGEYQGETGSKAQQHMFRDELKLRLGYQHDHAVRLAKATFKD